MPSRLLSAFPPGTPIRRVTLDEAIIAVSAYSLAGAGLGDGMALGLQGIQSGTHDLERK
jgi:ATP-dependent DNA helicase DinG